jgi:hypothetical protein
VSEHKRKERRINGAAFEPTPMAFHYEDEYPLEEGATLSTTSFS